MDANEKMDEVLDFDGEIQHDGAAFAVLPDNDEVEFTVNDVVKGRNKDGTLPQVRLELNCVSLAGHGRANVSDFITMTRKSEWKLCEFFTALGLRRHGETLKMNWDIKGRTGRATVIVEKFTKRDGSEGTGNKIKRYLESAPHGGDELSLA